MFGRQIPNIDINVSLDITSLQAYAEKDTPTFSGTATFNGPILSNSTLTQVGASTFTGAITANGGVNGNVTGNLTGNVNGNVTGDVTGSVTSSGITNSTYPLTNNSTLVQVGDAAFTGTLAANGGVFTNNIISTPKITYSSGVEYNTTSSTGIHNFIINGTQMTFINNLGLYNNFYFYQNADSTFAGAITANGGIKNNNTNYALVNKSTLSQIGASTFTGSITANGGINGNVTGNVTGTFYPTGADTSYITGINHGIGYYAKSTFHLFMFLV